MSCLPFISFYFEIQKVQLLQNVTLNGNFISKPSCMKFPTSFRHPPNMKRAPINTKYLPFCCSKRVFRNQSLFLHLTADEEEKTLKQEQEGREVHLSETKHFTKRQTEVRRSKSPDEAYCKTLFVTEVKSLKSRNRQERH